MKRRTMIEAIVIAALSLALQLQFVMAGTNLEKITEGLYLFRDTCNVYAVKAGEEAPLVDFGSGKVVKHLPEIGVNKISWVLHTHYHRDQCQGDGVLAELGARVAVPADQRRFFEAAQEVWNDATIYHNYSFKPDFFEPTRSIPIDLAIRPGEAFEWAGLRFETLAITGHTKAPSLAYIATIGGEKVAFTGDLIRSPGKVWTYHDMLWNYNQMAGVLATQQSLEALRALAPEMILPSHGQPMREPEAAIEQTVANLKETFDLLLWHPGKPEHPGSARGRIFPHIVHRGTSFLIIADSGHALFYDFAFVDTGADELVDELRRDFGLKQVDIVMPSHYHDDHVRGIPYLKAKYGAKLWAHESLVDILENPYRYNIPCLGAERYQPNEVGPRVDRVLRENESFEWEGYRFTVFHFPGQTEYHQGMYVEMDGHRMLFMGDSTYWPQPGTIFRGESFNARNYCRLGEGTGYLRCGELLKKWKPDVAMAAHFGPIPLDEKRIDEYYEWAKKLEPTFRKLVARDDPNFGTDPNWASFYPYRVLAEAGETIATEVRIRNHSDRQCEATIVPVMPATWKVQPSERVVSIGPKQTGKAEFTIVLPEGAPLPLRTVITADVTFDGADFGELAEMLIDKRSEKESWTLRAAEKVRQMRDRQRAPER